MLSSVQLVTDVGCGSPLISEAEDDFLTGIFPPDELLSGIVSCRSIGEVIRCFLPLLLLRDFEEPPDDFV